MLFSQSLQPHPKSLQGAPLFVCESTKEMEFVANNLEAILDGIAHRLQENVYIIVKH